MDLISSHDSFNESERGRELDEVLLKSEINAGSNEAPARNKDTYIEVDMASMINSDRYRPQPKSSQRSTNQKQVAFDQSIKHYEKNQNKYQSKLDKVFDRRASHDTYQQ